MTPFHSRFWPRLAMGLLILYWAGLVTGTHIPRLPVHLPGGGDKVAHFLAFAGLAFLLSWNWAVRRPFIPTGVLFALSVAALYGVLDELTQLCVPGRSGEVADWLADVLGALSGIVVFAGLDCVYRRFVRNAQPLSGIEAEG